MTRVTVTLNEQEAAALRLMAASNRNSIAAEVRRAVGTYLHGVRTRDLAATAAPANRDDA